MRTPFILRNVRTPNFIAWSHGEVYITLVYRYPSYVNLFFYYGLADMICHLWDLNEARWCCALGLGREVGILYI